jgi:hypothetical protein
MLEDCAWRLHAADFDRFTEGETIRQYKGWKVSGRRQVGDLLDISIKGVLL